MSADRVPQPGDRWRGKHTPEAARGVIVEQVTDDNDVVYHYIRSGTPWALTLAQFVRSYVFAESAADAEAVPS